jgi:hypothetical protein
VDSLFVSTHSSLYKALNTPSLLSAIADSRGKIALDVVRLGFDALIYLKNATLFGFFSLKMGKLKVGYARTFS